MNDLVKLIESFNESLKAHLPVLESEVNRLIETRCKEGKMIEQVLDTLLSFTGIADDLFIRLLEYYKTVDIEGALFYWEKYDELK